MMVPVCMYVCMYVSYELSGPLLDMDRADMMASICVFVRLYIYVCVCVCVLVHM
jgi:hypothetical protein